MDLVEFDMQGQLCPSTLLVALKEINAHADILRKGRVKLCFIIDNRDATITIPESASNMGYVATVAKKDRHYRIEISGKRN
jgi:TusA-related sulfurtransferase